ncbi:MAG: LytTR family transcriptional regulator [Hymenobacteraceae bacterium]|nr:LytTR family transcriptional regulator [Hymenobacteraceae bacterium]
MNNVYKSIPQPPSSPGLLPFVLSVLLVMTWIVPADLILLQEEREETSPGLLQLLPSILFSLALTTTMLLLARGLRRDKPGQAAPQPDGHRAKQPSQLAEADAPAAPVSPPPRSVFIAHTATQSVPIDVADICCFFREGRHNFLRTFDRCDYLLPQSLNEVQQELDSSQFFRVNRQLIIQRRACRSFRPAAYGKLELTLLQPLPFQAIVSQLKAAQFRRWMQG